MRNLILISFFACLFLHFRSEKSPSIQDSLSIGQASVKKSSSSFMHKIAPSAVGVTSEVVEESTDGSSSPLLQDEVNSPPESVSGDYSAEDESSDLPWDEIEEGWKNHLKEYLLTVSPDKADEMLQAYLEEKKKYVERVDYSSASDASESSGVSPSGSLAEVELAEDDLIQSEELSGEAQKAHVENLKNIFGKHFSQIEALHNEYLDSIQYLNRSSANISISL